MDPLTVEIVGMIVVPVVLTIGGLFLKAMSTKLAELTADMKQSQRRDDTIREVERIDRDISNTRLDNNKNFDILRNQMAEDKREVLDAISRIKS